MEEPEGYEARPMSPFGAIGWTLGMTFLLVVLVWLLASLRGSAEVQHDLVSETGCEVVAYLLGFFCILRLHAPDASIRQFIALRRTHALFFLAAPLLGVTVKAFTNVIYSLIVARFPTGQEGVVGSILSEASPGKRAAIFVALAVVGPAIEETIFRGAIVQALRKASPLQVVASTSAICFALAHVQWQVFPSVALAGLVFVALRLASGSLWPGILMHATFNAVEFGEIFWSRLRDVDPEVRFRYPLLGLGIAGTVILLLLIRVIANTEAARSARKLDEAAV